MNFFVILLILFPAVAFSQEEWDLKKDKDGIKVFLREIENSPYKEIKVLMKCKSTLKEFDHLIRDINIHKKWVYNNNILKLIERINENELVYYVEFDLPWPAVDRDVNTRLKVTSDSIPKTIFVNSKSVSGYIPPKEGNVRVVSSHAFWKVTEIDDDEIQIDYKIRLDPGGFLPPWLVNLTATIGPFNSFSALKNMLED